MRYPQQWISVMKYFKRYIQTIHVNINSLFIFFMYQIRSLRFDLFYKSKMNNRLSSTLIMKNHNMILSDNSLNDCTK